MRDVRERTSDRIGFGVGAETGHRRLIKDVTGEIVNAAKNSRDELQSAVPKMSQQQVLAWRAGHLDRVWGYCARKAGNDVHVIKANLLLGIETGRSGQHRRDENNGE
ncbi:MAG: hypothetical protein KJZ84_16775 [Bryobacteraceae bacterium]|nr:hypothetical protein [Bryobacteraceae bacterium]